MTCAASSPVAHHRPTLPHLHKVKELPRARASHHLKSKSLIQLTVQLQTRVFPYMTEALKVNLIQLLEL